MPLAHQSIRKMSHALGQDTVQDLLAILQSFGGAVVHATGDEKVDGLKTFSSSIGIRGIHYDWPAASGEGVLVNDGEGHLSWRTLAGTGTVSEVGLAAPPEFVVTSHAVTASGNLVLAKADQPANAIYAGPRADAPGQPSFRKLVAADIPLLTIDHVDHLAEITSKMVSVQEILDLRAALDDLGIIVGRKAESLALAEFEVKLDAALALKADVTGVDAVKAEWSQHLEASKQDFAQQFATHDQSGREWGTHLVRDVEAKLAEKAPLNKPTFMGAISTNDIAMGDGSALIMGQNKGVRIGKTRGDKLAFYGAIPVQQPAGDVVSGLANLGLIKDPTLSQDHVVGLISRLESIEAKLRGSE